MGYFTHSGRYANTHTLRMLASAARTANGSSEATELGDRATARLTLDVTAASGTNPTLDVIVETSEDGVTWRTVGSFAQKTVVAKERKSFSGLDRFVRASWTLGGTNTPSFTFSLAGESL